MPVEKTDEKADRVNSVPGSVSGKERKKQRMLTLFNLKDLQSVKMQDGGISRQGGDESQEQGKDRERTGS